MEADTRRALALLLPRMPPMLGGLPMLLQIRPPMLRGLPPVLLLLPRTPLILRGPPMLLLPPRKTLRMRSWRCGGSEEGDEEGGRSKAEMRCTWTVSQATSISEVYSISVQCTYMGESLLESSHGLGEPGQDLRVVRDQTLNGALNDIVLTSGYAGDLENALMEV